MAMLNRAPDSMLIEVLLSTQIQYPAAPSGCKSPFAAFPTEKEIAGDVVQGSQAGSRSSESIVGLSLAGSIFLSSSVGPQSARWISTERPKGPVFHPKTQLGF